MDMKQKRKIRQEQKNNNEEKSFPKISINWYITPYDKLLSNPY